MEKAPAGIMGSFSMLFLMVFGRFPEKFSFGIFFSPSKPNTGTIRLIIYISSKKKKRFFNQCEIVLVQYNVLKQC